MILSARPALNSALVVAVALLLTALLSMTSLFRRAELWLGDAQQRLVAREMPFSHTLVVDIDEESLRRLEPVLGVWPYRRDVFALVLDYLGELGAHGVCFDVLMSERRPGDQELALAVARNPDTVFGAGVSSYPLAVDGQRRALLDLLSWTVPASLAVEPWADFALPAFLAGQGASGRVGVVSLWPDLDGTVRRIPLFHRAQGVVLPSLALAATVGGEPPRFEYLPAQRALKLGGHVWPVGDDGQVALSFPRNANAVKSIPFYVLALAAMGASGISLDREGFKGRTVIIGSTALQSDAVQTPRGLMPGVYLLAVAQENLASDLLLKPPDRLATALLLLLALTVPVAWSVRRPPNPATIGATLLVGAALAYAANLGMIYWWQLQSPLLFALALLLLTGCGQLATLAVAELRHRRLAENQMRTALAVFDASKEGIFVTDAQNNIVSVNPAFTAITGYAADEVVGRNPRLLSSGRHDADFSRTMWQSIQDKGYWQGEIWNRRKSGEIYPQWLSINTIKGADGSIDKRIAIFSDLSGHKAAEQQIEFLAYHDALTGLPNRLLVHDRFEQASAHAERTRSKVALLFLDLDSFKTINDSLGHSVGDALLKEIAVRLGDCVRDTDTISRQGGDEFLLVLPELPDADAIAPVLVKIRERLLDPFDADGHELTSTVSIGIAIYPEDGRDFDTLLKKADTAMYRAKESGRNTYRFFDEQMNVEAVEHLSMRNGLRRAVEKGEFVLHYQPQIDLASGAVVGAEALIRWQHPDLGMIHPARFIPVAEESGLIVPIGEWVMREACRQAAAWKKDGLPELTMAVNLSPVQFKRGDLEQTVIGALEESGFNPAFLELEITESILIQNVESVLSMVKRLKLLGVKLSIDDFGTGYSSLSYLKRFAVDKLKIDQSFIRDLATDPDDATIVRAIIQMAHNLNLKTLAEGVENQEILEYLRIFRCDEAQGYYFSRPMPAQEFATHLSATPAAYGPSA